MQSCARPVVPQHKLTASSLLRPVLVFFLFIKCKSHMPNVSLMSFLFLGANNSVHVTFPEEVMQLEMHQLYTICCVVTVPLKLIIFVHPLSSSKHLLLHL